MIRIAGLALALVGGTVASGMGLSLMHGVLHENPTPVRAEVVGHEPVVRRATVARAVPIEPIAPETDQAADVAPVQTASLSIPGVIVIDLTTDARTSPAISVRPQARSLVPDADLLDLEPVQQARQAPPARKAVQRTTVARSVAAPAVQTVARAQPILAASSNLPPRTLIGVYR